MAEDIFSNQRVLGFDLETTGISISQSKIVQYGLIGSDKNGEEIRINSLVNPLISIPLNATKIHGITNDDVNKLPGFRAHIEKLTNLLNGSIVIGHNIKRYDWPILENEFLRCGKEIPKPQTIIDTLEIARNKYPGSSISLDALCKRFRIDNSKRTKHTALIDCELLSKVYINLIDQKEPTFDLGENNELKVTLNDKSDYYKKIILPTEKELSDHSEFLKKNLKKNFF